MVSWPLNSSFSIASHPWPLFLLGVYSRSSADDAAELAPQRRFEEPFKMCDQRSRACSDGKFRGLGLPASPGYLTARAPVYGPAILRACGSTTWSAAAEMRSTTLSSPWQASAASSGGCEVDSEPIWPGRTASIEGVHIIRPRGLRPRWARTSRRPTSRASRSTR